MADRDFHVRVILEAIIKGQNNISKFLQGADKDVQKFRKSLRELDKDVKVIPGFGGTATAQGPGGQFRFLGDVEKAIIRMRQLREEAARTNATTSRGRLGQLAAGFSAGRGEAQAIRKAFEERINLSKEAAQKERDAIDDGLKKQLQDIRNFHAARLAEFQKGDILEIKDRAAALAKEKADEANFLEDQIRARRQASIKIAEITGEPAAFKPDKGTRDRINQLRAEERQILTNRDVSIQAIKDRVRNEENAEKQEAQIAARAARRAVTKPDISQIVTEARAAHNAEQDIAALDSRLNRFGRTAGKAWGDFRLGTRLGRQELSAADREFIKTESRLTRIGTAFGQATRGAKAFINVRFATLIGIIQLLGTLVVQLGTALVALASSAIQAGAALGGALLSGATQLLPVVALLAAAFHRLTSVLQAAKLSDQATGAEETKAKIDAIRQATEKLADARYSLKKAGEAVKDSEFDLKQAGVAVKDAFKEQADAVKNLAEARKQAARDIVDANFEERDAALSLKEAELAVLDAKQRLKQEELSQQQDTKNIEDAKAQVREAQDRLAQARKEGDQTEIAAALQQLSVAEQDLQQINAQADQTGTKVKEARLAVQQAQLQQQEAVVRNKRAQEDAATARKKGVEGSDQVIAAQKQLVSATRNIATAEHQQVLAERSLRDSIHGLAIAKRDERDAERALTDARTQGTTAQKNLQKALGDLSPAEKQLLKSIQKIKEIYKTNFRPITDIIIGAFSRAVDRASTLLQDPKILSATKALAESIATSIDKISQFSISPEFKKFLEFTIREAAKNVPKITDAFIHLFAVLMRVAQAATPIFDHLLNRFEKFSKGLDERSKNTSGLEKFFGIAAKHLNSWISFAEAVGRLLAVLIKFAAPSGKGLLDDFTAKLNEWADWMNKHPKEIKAFFANMKTAVEALTRSLGIAGKVLFQAFSSKQSSQLSQLLLETVIPAFTTFIKLLGVLAGILNKILHLPLVGTFAKFAVQVIIIEKLFNRLSPVTQKFTNVFFALLKKIASGEALAALKGLVANFRAFLQLQREFGTLAALEAAFPKLVAGFQAVAGAIKAVGVASKAALFTPPIGVLAIIAAIIAIIILLDQKFHFLMPTLRLLLKAFQFVFQWIKDHWKLLLAILLGPFALVVLAVIKWRDKIIGFFEDIIDWVRNHWKLLASLIVAIFLPGAAIIIAIIKWHDKILEIVKSIPGAIIKFFEKLPGALKKIFEKIPGLLKDALKGLGDIVKHALQRIPVVGRFFGGGPSKEQTDARDEKVFATLPKKAAAKARALKKDGKDLSDIMTELVNEGLITAKRRKQLAEQFGSDILFDIGGTVPGSDGQAVPIIAHAGEWVLNKEQQAKVARNLGMTIEQLRLNIFGSATSRTEARKKTKPTTRANPFTVPGAFNLVPREDPDGIVVWFIEMADGAFGQVSARDAQKIIRTGGEFIPGYVRRSTHGFVQHLKDPGGGFERARGRIRKMPNLNTLTRDRFGFKMGGVIPRVQSFAEGGTVLASANGFGGPAISKNFTQHFEVTAQGETDWNYVMRLGAIHAQEAFT